MWTKLGDEEAFAPETLTIGNTAYGVHCRARSYVGQHLTDGKLPAAIAQAIAGPELELIDRLVEAGLWTYNATQGAYWIVDYLEDNPSREEVEARREAKRQAGAKGGRKSGQTRRARADRDAPRGPRRPGAERWLDAIDGGASA